MTRATHMLRAGASLLVICLATSGVARAQAPYGGSGYPPPARYPQAASPNPGAPGPDAYDDRDPGAEAAPPGGGGVDGAPPDLSRELNLRPGQQAAFQAYQAATTPTAAEQQQMDADARRVAGMTTPERLDFAAAQMRRDEADFARRADAVRRFYAQLSPEQRQRFDRLTGPDAGPPDGAGGYESPSAPPPR